MRLNVAVHFVNRQFVRYRQRIFFVESAENFFILAVGCDIYLNLVISFIYMRELAVAESVTDELCAEKLFHQP